MKNHYEINGETVKVFSNGRYKERFFFIDVTDLEVISDYSWRVYKTKSGYFRVETSVVKKGKTYHFSLARFLLNFPENHYADHEDRDPLNNRRRNIRIATPLQNSHNASKHKEKTTSKYKGVCYHKLKNLWFAYINHNKQRFNLGYFKSEIEAATAYDLKAKELHNDFAVINKAHDNPYTATDLEAAS